MKGQSSIPSQTKHAHGKQDNNNVQPSCSGLIQQTEIFQNADFESPSLGLIDRQSLQRILHWTDDPLEPTYGVVSLQNSSAIVKLKRTPAIELAVQSYLGLSVFP